MNENKEPENISEESESSAAAEVEEEDKEKLPEPSGEEKEKPFSDALDWVKSVVYAVAAVLMLNLFVFRSITVSGDSMNNTLMNNDKVLTENFFYTPKRGDIVIVQADRLKNRTLDVYGEPIIKRVIAVEGDTVCIDFVKGDVFINGELIEEDYIKDLTHLNPAGGMENGKEYTVPENCVFVMGDNRNGSNDSRNLRDLGFVDQEMIMGKAFVRILPFKDFKWL